MENRAARRRAAATAARSAKGALSQQTPTTVGYGAPPAIGTALPAGAKAVAVAAVEPEALVVTHWFDPGDDGEPYLATIRLTGRRVGVHGLPGPQDTFVQEDKIDEVVPGSGPVAVSSWVYGLQPGEWVVSAELIRPGRPDEKGRQPYRSSRPSAEPIPRAVWSWRRRTLASGATGPTRTRWAMLAPLARIPAVIPGSFTALASTGIVVALIVQAVLTAQEKRPVDQSLVVSVLAILAGLIAAKVWYAFLHPGPWRQALLGGWAVDGFLVVAPAVAVLLSLAFDIPVGVFLDAATPGIFFAVAIGRLGCFFTGCCAGPCTRSRWGVWSSDRRLGARRIPTQLLESAVGLVIGALTTLLVLGHVPGVDGLIFVAALGVYFIARQFLLRLRAEPRSYLWRRSTAVLAERSH